MRYRQAKQNQPKDDKPETRESRFLELMAHHKEDLARRLVDSEPIHSEQLISDLRESRDKHAEAIRTMHANLSAQLTEARKTIEHLRKARAAQEKRLGALFKNAARYRWLRENNSLNDFGVTFGYPADATHEEAREALDAAIDEKINSEQS